MSDEQKMPEVMTRKWYPTLATRMAGDSSVAAMVDCEQRYNQEAYVTYADHLATIATLTAERDAQSKQVRELVAATEYLLFACRDGAVFQRDHARQRATAALAQLKEQDDA